jgi:hypothetical protein
VLNRALLSLWMNLAVHTLMRLPRTRDLRTWFFFDEVHALHRLPAIEDGLQTARGFGGAFVLGIHSFAKLAETYGKEGAQNLASLARTKLILAAADRDTAEHCSDYIGHREVRMMDEAYSYGYSNIRDAATITPRSEVQPLVLPDDIMKLPSLRGFLVFPEGFDAARIKLTTRTIPRSPKAMFCENVEPIEFMRETQADEADEAGGRETKEELELARDTAPDEALRQARTPTLRQEELNFPVAPPIGPSGLPASSLGRSMIVSQAIAGSPSQSQARESEAGPKSVQQSPKAAPQRQSQAARELGEAVDDRGRDGRTREGAKEAELDSPATDDGLEM